MAASQKEHWRDHQAHIHSISLAGELNARVSEWLLIQCRYIVFFNFHHSFQACHSSSRVVVTLDPSNGVSTSLMCNTFNPLLRYTINLVLLGVDINSTIISQDYYARSTHQTQQPFYTSVRRQKNHVLRENYASELPQVIMQLSSVGLTS